MPTDDEYRFCARLGMHQAECARHLGISRTAVAKAKARLSLTFGMAWQFTPEGREMEQVYFRYPWGDFAVGDWIRSSSGACVVANRANKKNPDKTFRARRLGWEHIVVRVA